MKALDFLKEDVSVYGWDHKGFEMARYDYSLTEDGKKLLERKKKRYPEEWEKMERCAKAIKDVGNLNYMELAMAAKAYMIINREGGKANKSTIKTIAEKLGWSITETELDRAIDFLDKIKLAHWK